MYIVMTQGREDMHLFLVDRRKIKDRWWSYDYTEAYIFRDIQAATNQANKLIFKHPIVVSVEEARSFSNDNDSNIASYEHPFSSDALGQW